MITGESGNKNIYWNGITGSRRVILRKIKKNSYESVKGALFDAYKGTNAAVIQVDNGTSGKIAFQNIPSQDSGVIWIGDLTYGTYYLHETNDGTSDVDKWFYFILDGEFQIMSEAYGSRELAKTAADAEALAISWANRIIEGTKTYSEVPDEQKTRVSELLTLAGYGNLIRTD